MIMGLTVEHVFIVDLCEIRTKSDAFNKQTNDTPRARSQLSAFWPCEPVVFGLAALWHTVWCGSGRLGGTAADITTCTAWVGLHVSRGGGILLMSGGLTGAATDVTTCADWVGLHVISGGLLGGTAIDVATCAAWRWPLDRSERLGGTAIDAATSAAWSWPLATSDRLGGTARKVVATRAA